ncbi:hypothetical protein CONPUDRAFT_159006 [Coniophora puteana RWD-64-598 SS2]|uniref:HTH cro/C1-type domain-containing protein n=1 Tax=Coniophora puteana (strain RWD-64-598) TaxID=741705 RepID=A0A5M3M9M0_CONPW|nr:uncharacterized protein CONPUDRAFT_159006 [Coniophora puteana RWD-64-598 SS2]EIW75554.1 hypothetical protein CONPUDRAFT_159006 [Coniophora puteana RWD-64-598 SS2]
MSSEFCAGLTSAMNRKNLTLEQVAGAIGSDVGRTTQIFKGQTNPTDAERTKLYSALGIQNAPSDLSAHVHGQK